MSKRGGTMAVAVAFILGGLASQFFPAVYGQPKKIEKPSWFHGVDLKVRKAGEFDFKDAKKIGVECFRDENNGNIIYISETGSIAVLPGK